MTRNEFKIKRDIILSKIEKFEELQKECITMIDIGLESNTYSLVDEYGDKWNLLENKINSLYALLRQIEFQYQTRNWNSQDWYMYDLVTNNID